MYKFKSNLQQSHYQIIAQFKSSLSTFDDSTCCSTVIMFIKFELQSGYNFYIYLLLHLVSPVPFLT